LNKNLRCFQRILSMSTLFTHDYVSPILKQVRNIYYVDTLGIQNKVSVCSLLLKRDNYRVILKKYKFYKSFTPSCIFREQMKFPLGDQTLFSNMKLFCASLYLSTVSKPTYSRLQIIHIYCGVHAIECTL
jgi:hypothetical protein